MMKIGKHQTIFVFTILVASLTLVACTNREVTVTKHEGPIVGDEVDTNGQASALDIPALKKVDVTSMNAKVTSARVTGASAVPQNERVEALTALEPFVLNRTYLDNPRLTHTKQMRAALSAFTGNLVDLAATNPQAAAPWIEKTRLAIESGCDGLMQGCTNIGFFRADGDSAKVMELSAKSLNADIENVKTEIKKAAALEKSDAPASASLTALKEKRDGLVRLYFRRLGVAFDLKNQNSDSQLEFSYLVRARDYSDAFENSAAKTRERELLARHTEVFEMILNRFNPDLSDPEFRTRFEAFIDAFAPWNYSRRTENPFGQAATRMLSLAAKSFLYSGKSGELSASLKEAIANSQKLSSSELKDGKCVTSAKKSDENESGSTAKSLDVSFASLKTMLSCEEPQLWSNLLLSDSFNRDEYFFMIDRVYGGHLTPDDASEIWRGSRRDSKALLDAAEKYIKVQIAGQVVRTNRYMANMYSKKNFSATTLFTKAVEESFPISTQWQEMFSRIGRVQLFLDRNLKASDESFNSPEYQSISTMLTSAGRNIKYLSVYPNMMLMSYFMAEVRFKFPLRTAFGDIEIDSSTIISWFFDGKMAPLFAFGNDNVGLKRIETLYAFLFALKTETFKAFRTDENDLSVPKFFDVVIGKYLESDRIDLERYLENIRKQMRQSSAMATFLQVCRQDRDFLSQKVKIGSKGNTLSIEFGKLNENLYVGTSTSYGSDAMTFHIGGLVAQTKTATESLRKKLEFVATMVALYDKYLENSHVDATARAAFVQKINNNLAAVKGLQREYLTEVIRWNRALSPCIDQAMSLEIDRQDDAVDMEAKHLATVWKQMKSIREAKSGAAPLVKAANEAIWQSIGLKEIATSIPYKPVSEISGDEYVYGKLDTYLRLRQNLKTIAPNVRVLMPSDLSDTSDMKERQLKVIAFTENQADFVREGLRTFNDSSGSNFKWMGTTPSAEIFKRRIELLVELYKLGPIEIYDWTAASCQGKANISECPLKNDFRISAKEIVDEATNVTKLLSLTNSDGKPKRDTLMLNNIGQSSRWSKGDLFNFTLDKNGESTWPLDFAYLFLTNDVGPFTDATEFYTTEQSVGHFLFAPEKDFKTILGRGVSPLINGHFDRVRTLEAAIADREKQDAANNSIISYTYEIRDGNLVTSTVAMNGRNPVYLSNIVKDDMSTRVRLFHEATANAFKLPSEKK